MKKEKELQGAIEAILFTMGESVELNKIARAIEQDEETTLELIHKLMTTEETCFNGCIIGNYVYYSVQTAGYKN